LRARPDETCRTFAASFNFPVKFKIEKLLFSNKKDKDGGDRTYIKDFYLEYQGA
jgi:hypothetical protein